MFLVDKGIGAGLTLGPPAADPAAAAVRAYADKDLRAALALGEELGMALPATTLALARLTEMTGIDQPQGGNGI